MKVYQQLLIILSFSFLGEILSTVFYLPVPGSVVGMIALFCALQFKLLEVRQVEQVGNFLLSNLSILFLPASVGVMVYFPVIRETWWKLLVIIALTTIFTIAFVGTIVQRIKRRYETESSDVGNESERI